MQVNSLKKKNLSISFRRKQMYHKWITFLKETYLLQHHLVPCTTISSFDYEKKKKSEKKTPVDGYEAKLENNKKILPPPTKKTRKSKQINVISEQETSDTSKPSETDNNPMPDVIPEGVLNYLVRTGMGTFLWVWRCDLWFKWYRLVAVEILEKPFI